MIATNQVCNIFKIEKFQNLTKFSLQSLHPGRVDQMMAIFFVSKKGNIYSIQRTNNHCNSTCTTRYICIQMMLYVIFCFKMAHNLKSVPTQDKFLDFLQRQFFRFEIIYSSMLHITGMNWSFTEFFLSSKGFLQFRTDI